MNDQPRRSITELLADRDLITAAINRAVREVVLKHAQAGHPIVGLQNGKMVWLSPSEILADFASDAPKDNPPR